LEKFGVEADQPEGEHFLFYQFSDSEENDLTGQHSGGLIPDYLNARK
jgi:hypothetical protein